MTALSWSVRAGLACLAQSRRAVTRAFIMGGMVRPDSAPSVCERSCALPELASIKDLCGSCWTGLTDATQRRAVAGLPGVACGTMRRFDAPPRPVLQYPAVRVQKSQRPDRVAAIARGGSRMVFHITAMIPDAECLGGSGRLHLLQPHWQPGFPRSILKPSPPRQGRSRTV